jgi:D-serine deaminase-like pyridoxal phosphate-dependent protein
MPRNDPSSVSATVAAYEADRVLDPWLKGRPVGRPGDAPSTPTSIAAAGGSLFDATHRTPFALLRSSAVDANIAAMARFCIDRSLTLAPHAKTSMSPQLVGAQLAAGAWAVTAALPSQVERLWDFGVGRVLLANEVADPNAMRQLGARLDVGSERELLCFIDSTDGVALAERGLADVDTSAAVGVLVDVGHPGGRTGTRSLEQTVAVARAVDAAPHLRLAGIGGYEGTIGNVRDEPTRHRVDHYLHSLGATLDAVIGLGLVAAAQPVVSAGGSIWFDRVAAVLGPLAADGTARVVLRSGCYVSHDHGLYARAAPTNVDDPAVPAFRPALEVWARVVSRPEPRLALVDAGRRDLSHDAGLPLPLAARRPDGTRPHGTEVTIEEATVTGLSDQHAFLSLSPGSTLSVGDLVSLGISHPCTTFDRWPLLLRVDDHDAVLGVVRTYF